jgi:hypothetical protein
MCIPAIRSEDLRNTTNNLSTSRPWLGFESVVSEHGVILYRYVHWETEDRSRGHHEFLSY